MLLLDIYVFFIALFLGSFFNVVAIRLLKKESIVYPHSNCPNCNHKISALDLIPIFSFLLLKGQCRYCHTKISPLYPFGELLTASSLFIVYKFIGFELELIPAVMITIVLILSVLTDIREQLILDVITIPALVILLITRLFIGTESFWFYGIGGGLVLSCYS
ncbi:prepilin peptidase [Halalkalibacter alkalisediminis]|uniref:prepilin peptidase n=1 Tax=Halalkalibacter alkalisediminis TaxID=935616 RepID=UPI003626F235